MPVHHKDFVFFVLRFALGFVNTKSQLTLNLLFVGRTRRMTQDTAKAVCTGIDLIFGMGSQALSCDEAFSLF